MKNSPHTEENFFAIRFESSVFFRFYGAKKGNEKELSLHLAPFYRKNKRNFVT